MCFLSIYFYFITNSIFFIYSLLNKKKTIKNVGLFGYRSSLNVYNLKSCPLVSDLYMFYTTKKTYTFKSLLYRKKTLVERLDYLIIIQVIVVE